MRIHDELCAISSKVSNNYTIPLGVNLVFQYGMCLFCLFYCYWMYSIKPFSSICWLAWGFIKMTEMVHISISCHLAVLRSRETGSIVHKLLLKPFQTEVGYKLIAFSKQLMHGKVEFTIWGLFPIDASLLYTMTSAAATYMIIMLQFQQSSLPMTCKANVANSTIS
ncbi:hypothetical protein FQR65_LT11746 [Abscondita terminalis]|nr:hypothetical protein FQR65_LT11746 [Abscondita terminalis]